MRGQQLQHGFVYLGCPAQDVAALGVLTTAQRADASAGTLLIQEAGGRIGTLSGGEYTQGGNILCGTPKVYDAMLELLAPHLPEGLREG